MRWLLAHPGPGFSVHDVYVGYYDALEELGEQTFEFNLDDRLVFYDRAYLLADEERGLFRKALDGDTAIAHALNGLAAALWKLQPHVLVVVSGFFTDMNLLDHARRLGTKVVLLCTESPYEEDRQYALAAHADLVVLNDPTNLDVYREITEAVYLPHAYRPALHHPGPAVPDLVCDLGFVGTGYPSRIEFFEQFLLAWEGDNGGRAGLPPEQSGKASATADSSSHALVGVVPRGEIRAPSGLELMLGGNWMRLGAEIGGALEPDSPLRKYLAHDINECMDNTDAADLYRSARVGLNLYRREAAHPELEQGWAMGPREVEMAACGLFYLRDPRPEGDDLLPMLPTFDGPDDAADKVRWYLAHPILRADLARQAREAVTDRTFVSNARQLLRLLDRVAVTASRKGSYT